MLDVIEFARRPGIPPIRSSFLTISLAVAVAITVAAPADADEHLFERGISQACTPHAQELGSFADVPRSNVHATAIDCLQRWQITRGRDLVDGDRFYDPAGTVERQAMASFIARAMGEMGTYTLPEPAEPFPDVTPGDVHTENIARLRAAGVVEGRDDGTYGPGEPVERAAMASFITRMIETIDEPIPVPDRFDPAFPDTSGVHEANIDKLASIGVVEGRADGTYGPDQPVSRAAMASFIARSLDHLADRGHLPVPEELELSAERDEAPQNLNHRIGAQVSDQFGDGYFAATVRYEVYRDDALVVSGERISQAEGEANFSYNAGAAEGDTDLVVACLVEEGDDPTDGQPLCADVEGGDVVPIDDRLFAELAVDWGATQEPSEDRPGSEFTGEIIEIDVDDQVLLVQMITQVDAPGGFYEVDYSDATGLLIEGDEVDRATFECAAERTVGDEGVDQRLTVGLTRPELARFDLSTTADIGDCS